MSQCSFCRKHFIFAIWIHKNARKESSSIYVMHCASISRHRSTKGAGFSKIMLLTNMGNTKKRHTAAIVTKFLTGLSMPTELQQKSTTSTVQKMKMQGNQFIWQSGSLLARFRGY